MNRAYALLRIKSIDEDLRVIEGIATTPTPDRLGDIVEPEGAEFSLPIPLLWQHRSEQPIGHVVAATVTEEGITIRAKLAKVDEPGNLKNRLDEAWQSIKAGLVAGLSIGFKEIEVSRIADTFSYRYIKWLWLELSAVTIPANAETTITAIKSIDSKQRAASGRSLNRVVRLTPGVAGKPPPPVTPQEGTDTMPRSIAEQIAALEATRAAKAARMEEIMKKALEGEGRTTDEAEREEFDALQADIKSVDGDLDRFRFLEKNQAKTAKPVATVDSATEAAATRSNGTAPAVVGVRLKITLPPGVRFARLAKVKAIARLDNVSPKDVAAAMYGADSETVALVTRAAVVAGSNLAGNWAAGLTGDETGAIADFAAYLRPATILGKFGVNGVPSLRQVPFREPLVSQTGAGEGYWVGEGKPKPLTAFNFARTTINPLKVANIAILTEENIRSSNPSSELIVRDSLRDALGARMDQDFIDPANAGSANIKPAAITNGAETVASTGTDADAIRLDVRALFQKFIDADNPPESGVWIMSTANALALSMMVNTLGQREFPGVTMTGGTFEGMPVIASRYAGSIVALVNASDIYEADEGEVAVDMSREASVEMKDSALTQDATAGTGVAMVSLWQSNLVGLRAERVINWMRRRTSAVAYLTGVAWGGAVPAS